MKPTKNKFTILKQVIEKIPSYLVSKIAKKYNIDRQSRSFSPWSHVVSMLFAQISHALSLNDVCDTLKHHSGVLSSIRNATPPSRNGLSHANKTRDAAMAKELFYETLSSLRADFPRFGRMDKPFKLSKKIKRVINIVDSTTIQLFANCMEWAKHRRRKAAAKCHMLLDAQTFLPRFAVVKTAKSSDSVEAHELCSRLQDGEIVIFDKAYVDFAHLYILLQRGIFWITRAKSNMTYRVCKKHPSSNRNILLDAEIVVTGTSSKKKYPERMRLIRARVERDGKMVEMEFITNNFEWSAKTITDLYKARWEIELFFKQIKQTLKLSDFLGYSENAVLWQIWMALLTYVIMRFLAYMSEWKGTFSRLFTMIRGVLWSYFDLYGLLTKSCGTAEKPVRLCACPEQLYLALFPD